MKLRDSYDGRVMLAKTEGHLRRAVDLLDEIDEKEQPSEETRNQKMRVLWNVCYSTYKSLEGFRHPTCGCKDEEPDMSWVYK